MVLPAMTDAWASNISVKLARIWALKAVSMISPLSNTNSLMVLSSAKSNSLLIIGLLNFSNNASAGARCVPSS